MLQYASDMLHPLGKAFIMRATGLALVGVCLSLGVATASAADLNSAQRSSAVDATITDYRPATEEIANFELPEGFRIDLVAAEPLVVNPVCIALDDKNRLYVAESHTYRYGPSGSPVKPATNPIVRLDPLPDGTGFTRTLVAEGFDDPVMGMAIRDGRLWATANDKLFRFDLTEAGPATAKTTLLVDKNKAWNPFGMFVLEWGLDGSLLMSVGNHEIDIGPEGQPKGQGIIGRGGSGIVMRMNPDGTELERLVHGLRVPYAFEIDPFGQHWQLSNGEGNPNRFVRVIDGVDYLCYSRPHTPGNWLAGTHPLAPPCFELPRGATTQLLRYYGANFPASYQGSLFIDNWAAHGFGGPNRTISRYVPDARNAIVAKEEFLTCRDPHFRCSHVLMAPDGSLYVADWYGRDDESDTTGRIWRVSYTVADRPAAPTSGPEADALAAAHALWKLVRDNSPDAEAGLVAESRHPDWRVRRLALLLLRRTDAKELPAVAQSLVTDSDLAVRVTAARFLADPVAKRTALMAALRDGAAADDHLRYEAAWHLADVADQSSLETLLASADERLRHAGLIAIDVSGYENRPSAAAAMTVLGTAIRQPDRAEQTLVFELASMHHAQPVVDALRSIVANPSADPLVTARAILLLRAKSATESLDQPAIDRFIAAVKTGKVPVHSVTDQTTVLDLIEPEGPTEFMIGRSAAARSWRPLSPIAHPRSSRPRGPGSPSSPRLSPPGPQWPPQCSRLASTPPPLPSMPTSRPPPRATSRATTSCSGGGYSSGRAARSATWR